MMGVTSFGSDGSTVTLTGKGCEGLGGVLRVRGSSSVRYTVVWASEKKTSTGDPTHSKCTVCSKCTVYPQQREPNKGVRYTRSVRYTRRDTHTKTDHSSRGTVALSAMR